jgi:hypothetical protein
LPAPATQLNGVVQGLRVFLRVCRNLATELRDTLHRAAGSAPGTPPWNSSTVAATFADPRRLVMLRPSAGQPPSSRTSSRSPAPNAKRFVFLAGLEGTGHHTWHQYMGKCAHPHCGTPMGFGLKLGTCIHQRARLQAELARASYCACVFGILLL